MVIRLAHIPSSVAEVDQIFDSANVIVTTMHIAGRADPQVQEQLAARAAALFIDEAHHIGARTWAEFRGLFVDRKPSIPIVQFTATPFREDGRRVDGEFIYTYPLKKAQEEGYFKPIRFEAVFGLDRPDADLAIIDKLGEVLAADLDAGLNHLAMARCSTIERAKHLHGLYTAAYPKYRPVIVHSQLALTERRENLVALRRFKSRIIVCVDMLGEGFDLPELKIAALHDHHKSVAVTIQFVGRCPVFRTKLDQCGFRMPTTGRFVEIDLAHELVQYCSDLWRSSHFRQPTALDHDPGLASKLLDRIGKVGGATSPGIVVFASQRQQRRSD